MGVEMCSPWVKLWSSYTPQDLQGSQWGTDMARTPESTEEREDVGDVQGIPS